MKKITLLAFLLPLFVSCVNDDTDFSAYINGGGHKPDSTETVVNDTVSIVYHANSVTVTGERSSCVAATGAHVIVNDALSNSDLVLLLSGETSDGSLLVYRSLKYTLVLNGVSITNPHGSALNNQCKKALHITIADGTVNTLSDGTIYTDQEYDQKGTVFSEGQIYFSGTGTLNVNGNSKNGIACDDYIFFDDGNISVSVGDDGSNGVKVNDGLTINGGTLTISVTADGARGIKSDAYTTITGGETTITTSGDCQLTVFDDGTRDTTSCACIKSDSLFVMTGGTLTMTSSGDGGKGINCNENIEINGGVFVAKTTGDNDLGKPKAVKSDTGIILRGGSFTATVNKSWACDNGTDSEEPEDHLTIVGTPLTKSIKKKEVVVSF